MRMYTQQFISSDQSVNGFTLLKWCRLPQFADFYVWKGKYQGYHILRLEVLYACASCVGAKLALSGERHPCPFVGRSAISLAAVPIVNTRNGICMNAG